MDNILLLIFAALINAAALFFGLPPALKARKEGKPYREWDESKGRYVEKLSWKVKIWQTDAGKIWIIAQAFTIGIAIAIISFVNS
jgi:hypothetical protein